ncbi:sterol regulatory element-binding protein 1 [Striga asiatica]|uniref:Sterol regulatory element-binding protein 1 n=1 Tax=Striga asiatica TaxID=4170 RepID=A0A5A7QVR3_STRAF|nr:sterol regulatory element-binding protein 1 [Striga asiatica]
MGSKPRISAAGEASGRPRATPPGSNQSLTGKPQTRSRGSAHTAATAAAGEVVSDKLETLRNLIRSQDAGENPDQLFREAADYIVLLKTQVFVLQKLVGFYGAQPQENRDGGA